MFPVDVSFKQSHDTFFVKDLAIYYIPLREMLRQPNGIEMHSAFDRASYSLTLERRSS